MPMVANIVAKLPKSWIFKNRLLRPLIWLLSYRGRPSTIAALMDQVHGSRMEVFPLEVWNQDIAVGLTGAFLCARTFGEVMAQQGKGAILNVASDLALISPDQRLYRKSGLPEQFASSIANENIHS